MSSSVTPSDLEAARSVAASIGVNAKVIVLGREAFIALLGMSGDRLYAVDAARKIAASDHDGTHPRDDLDLASEYLSRTGREALGYNGRRLLSSKQRDEITLTSLRSVAGDLKSLANQRQRAFV